MARPNPGIAGFTTEQVSFLTAQFQCILDETLTKYFGPLPQPITEQNQKQKKNQKTRKQYKRRILQARQECTAEQAKKQCTAESTQCSTKNPSNLGFLSTILHPATKQFCGGVTLLTRHRIARILASPASIRFGKHFEASGEG